MKVLVADDDEVCRVLLQHLVETLRHECLVADDGLRAWDHFWRNDPDVVISDWNMPSMDGIDLCRRVRAVDAESGDYTYFIFLTVREDTVSFLTAMREGADDFLTKPLDDVEVRVRLGVAERLLRALSQVKEQQEQVQALNRQLRERAREDPLTALGTETRLREDLDVENARVVAYGHAYALALFNIDHFTLYNQYSGASAGDDAIEVVGRRLADLARGGDRVYHLRGGEFAVFLPEQSHLGARAAVERLQRQIDALAIPHPAMGPEAKLTVSAGVALVRARDEVESAQVLRRATELLSLARALGHAVAVQGDLMEVPR